MQILESEKYEDYAAEFQFEMIRLLNDTLKKHYIPVEKRKEICAAFAFDFSMIIDHGEISDTMPMVAFYREDTMELYIGSGTFEFHDYAFGNTDAVFEEEDGQEAE